jgi:hypothetical protein
MRFDPLAAPGNLRQGLRSREARPPPFGHDAGAAAAAWRVAQTARIQAAFMV